MSLDDLRRELARVDREILERVARRHELSSKIGKVKRATGQAPRDYGQEKTVLQRAGAAAEDLGFSPQLAEQLMLLLIRSSLTVQEQHQIAAEGSGNGRRALVVGGRGKMGGWFVRFLASQGFDVGVADPAGGSWYAESLTDDLARAAWAHFGGIESGGKMSKALTSGWAQPRPDGTMS